MIKKKFSHENYHQIKKLKKKDSTYLAIDGSTFEPLTAIFFFLISKIIQQQVIFFFQTVIFDWLKKSQVCRPIKTTNNHWWSKKKMFVKAKLKKKRRQNKTKQNKKESKKIPDWILFLFMKWKKNQKKLFLTFFSNVRFISHSFLWLWQEKKSKNIKSCPVVYICWNWNWKRN